VLTTVLHTARLEPRQIAAISAVLPGELQACRGHYRLYHHHPVLHELLPALRGQLPFDINPLPASFDSSAVRLVVSDMDSTFITIECLDEIADLAGLRAQVAPVTAAAMRGEIDFAGAMRERLALLKGLDLAVLDTVYRERLTLMPGARELLQGLKQQAIPFALVSGGFSQFTGRLQQELGFEFSHGISPEIEGGVLTGRIYGELIDAAGKTEFVRRLCRELEIETGQVIALGDGANDLPMLQGAGLGIAYRARPVVQAAADAVLNCSGLEAVLDFID
jgi:phosphoserine phosphatase